MGRDRPSLRASAKSAPGRAGPAVIVGGVIALGYLGLFFVFPLIAVLARGFSDGFGGTNVFGSARFWSVAWFTVWQSTLSTVLTVVVAAPITAVLGRWRFRGDRIVSAVVAIPFVLPTIVVATAFASLFDRLGWSLTTTTSTGQNTAAIIAAHVYFNVSVVVRLVGARWRYLDPKAAEAARVLGAGPLRAFQIGIWPRLRRSVGSAAVIVYLFTFTSFAVIVVLGGPGRATIETEIYRYAVSRADFSVAAVLGTIQLLAVVAITAALRRSQAGASDFTERGGEFVQPVPRHQRIPVGVLSAMAVALTLAPLAAMSIEAFSADRRPSVANFAALSERIAVLPVSGTRAIANSLLFASVSMVLATIAGTALGALLAYGPPRVGRLVDVGVLLPLGTSAVMIGFGMLLAFASPPLDLRTSPIIVPLAQSLIGIGFVVRAIVPALAGIDRRVRESAAVLGASRHEIRRRIDLPAALPAVAVGAGFAFSVSLGEFGATSFVGRDPQWLTVPLAIARLLGQPGDRPHGLAMALGVVVVAITAAIAALTDRRGARPTL